MNAQQIINDLLYIYECCNAPKLSSEYVHVLNIYKENFCQELVHCRFTDECTG